MKINLEFIDALLQMQIAINQTDLKDVEIYEKGERVEIDPSIIDEWRIIGLSNIDFYETRYWETRDLSIDGKEG